MTYSVGLFGLSWVGVWHYDAFDEVDGIEVTAIADVDEGALREWGDEWGIPESARYTDHEALLAGEDLDAVSVATPTFLHAEHVIDAAKSSAEPAVIWAEKPIATSVSEADEMVDVCSDAGIELVVNHARRFATPYQTVKQLLDEGELLGEIEAIDVGAPEELLRNGTHSVDLVNYLLGEEYVRGFGFLTEHSERMNREFDDSGGAGMLLTEEDTYVHLDCTLPRAVHDRRLTFVGTDGKLSIDGGRDTCQYWHLEEAEDAPYGQTHVKQKLPQTLDGFSDQRAMFRNGAAHVVELLEGTAENISPGSDAAHVLETIVALFLSHYTNSAVELPLSRPLRDVRIRSQ